MVQNVYECHRCHEPIEEGVAHDCGKPESAIVQSMRENAPTFLRLMRYRRTYTAADLAAARAEERERCAEVADAAKAEHEAIFNNPNVLYSTAEDAFTRASEAGEIAAAIRAMK